MKYYKNMDDWRKDYELFKNNPNDKNLMIKLIEKLEKSPKSMRDDIARIVEEEAMLDQPMMVLKQISRRKPECFIVINSKDFVWFEV